MVKKMLLVVCAGFVMGIMAHLNREGSSQKEPYLTATHTGSSLIPCAYAAKKDKKEGKKDKKGGKGKGKDKDRGPSVPGIPMAAAALIGLGGIGAAAYILKKKKK